MMKKSLFYLLTLSVFGMWSCSSSSDESEPPTPIGVTFAVPSASANATDITENSATLKIKVTSGTPSTVGFCYAVEKSTPTVSDDKVVARGQNGEYIATLYNLLSGTTYNVRAYALSGSDVSYSSQWSFTTEAVVNPTPEDVQSYRGPAYKDDYRMDAGWDKRSTWNLANVHDPTVMLADDGYYYMYQTDASFGNAHSGHGHFHGRRSKDLVNWEYLGAAMPSAPEWLNDKTNEYRTTLGLPPVTITEADMGFWAPTVRNLGNGTYRMYYSIVNDGILIESGAWPERSYIGMMETKDPASNQWEDKGFVLCAASDQGTNWQRPGGSWSAYNKWNAIDPSFIITPEGEHWLIYGSWHSGLAAVQLDPATGKTLASLPNPWGTAEDIAPYGKLVATRKMGDRWQGSEGPEVVYHDGYYYLFMAYDGLDVPYNTRVVRSDKIDGPYVSMDGTNVSDFGGDAYPVVTHPYKFNGNQGWVGISHCAVWSDKNDNWYFASQARYPGDFDEWAPNAIMLGHVRAVRWTKEGWPLVMPERYGAVPQVVISEAEIAGTWENIDLQYVYGKQQASQIVVLGADHTVSGGPWSNAKWSYDAGNQVLTIDGTDLYLMRECNWEDSNRRATIVYCGYSGNGKKTYWGKRVN